MLCETLPNLVGFLSFTYQSLGVLIVDAEFFFQLSELLHRRQRECDAVRELPRCGCAPAFVQGPQDIMQERPVQLLGLPYLTLSLAVSLQELDKPREQVTNR